jgi:hypothetical protein
MTDFPSYELVQRFMHQAGFAISDPDDEMFLPEAKFMKLASRLIQHGADQELEACCELLEQEEWDSTWIPVLRAARRPKPPSLKEQAMCALVDGIARGGNDPSDIETIRRALEALPE